MKYDKNDENGEKFNKWLEERIKKVSQNCNFSPLCKEFRDPKSDEEMNK